MELRDIIVTPIIILLVYAGAYVIRPWVTDELNRKYFFPALTLKIFGALALGFLYQFYYEGGDTFAYHTHGSRHIWEAFMQSPAKGIDLLFSQGQYGPGYWDYAEKIWYYRDPQSYFVIRISAILDLFTFSSYSGTAVLFATLAFTGAWMMFLTFYSRYPSAHQLLAIGALFVPSVIFWGSGILKDTVTLAFIGISTFCVSKIFVEKKIRISHIILLLLSFYVIFSVKKYILISFLAGVVAWVASDYFLKIGSMALRIMLIPFVIFFCGALTYYSVNKVVEDDPRYSLDKLAETARVTAYDIRYWTGKDAGSGYSIGQLDGTIGGMVRLAPKAINVSLFRPYFWEVKNPLMVMSAIESLLTLVFTLVILFKVRSNVVNYLKADVIFCLVFALIFAFGVGISTFNFGTLARYKIPLLPYYLTALGLIYHFWKSDKKVEEFERTEYPSTTF